MRVLRFFSRKGSDFKYDAQTVVTFGVTFAIIFFCTAYLYYGTRAFFPDLRRILDLDPRADWGGVYQCGAAFALLLIPAVLLARRGLGLSWRDMGFGLGDWRIGLRIAVPLSLAILVLVPLSAGLVGADSPLCRFYPLAPFAAESTPMYLAWEAFYLVYYVAWEGLFRGVIQLGLSRYLGVIQALLLQTALTTLLHAPNPEIETFAALAAGPVLGLLALRTGSIWYVLMIHFAAGAATDLCCILAAS